MRTEKELWELVLSRQDLFWVGLCTWINVLANSGVINVKEWKFLHKTLRFNLPEKCENGWCWKPSKIQPRIDWINERIKQLENETI
jgi:hypothetical protein